MADNLRVQAELRLKDNLTKQARSALEGAEKSAQKAGKAIDAIGQGDGAKRLSKEAQAAAKGMDAIADSGRDAARSTDAVAQKARDAGRGLQNAERKASALRRSLRGVGQTARDAASQMRTLGKGVEGAWRSGVGVAASAYAGKTALEQPVSRERQYVNDANIADVDVKTLRELDAAAVKYGGGTLEGARATRGVLFAQGGLDFEAASKVLPDIQRTATAIDAEDTVLAAMVAQGIKAEQFRVDEVKGALGRAVNAGSIGAFETKDMAKYMPGIMTNAKDMRGMRGFAYHLANLQVMRDAAGSSDEAGTLYENLQAFRTSPEATKNLKKKGVNLTAIYQHAAAAGDDMNVAFVGAIQRGVVEKDKLYKKLTAQMKTASGEEREALQRQLAARQSTLFGQIIGDRQARQAAVALANGGERRAEILQAIEANPQETVDKYFDRVQSTTQARFEALGNAWETAMDGFFGGIKTHLDTALAAVAGTMDAHPTASVVGAGVVAAGGTVAAGSAAVSAWDFFRGKKSGAAPGAGTTAIDAAEGAGKSAGKVGKGLSAGRLAKIGGPLALLLAAFDAISTETDDSLTRSEKNVAHAGTAGGLVGGMAGGAAAGAALGSVVPGAGTAIGAIIGGILGALGGKELGESIGKKLFGDHSQQDKGPEPDEYDEALTYVRRQQAAQGPQPINATIELNVNLDGDKVAAAVERRQLRESARH